MREYISSRIPVTIPGDCRDKAEYLRRNCGGEDEYG